MKTYNFWPEGFMKMGFVRINALLWADTLSSYAMFVMQDYLTDVWGLYPTHASAILNIWGGVSKLLPVLFLFFVDTLLGNFKMLVISSISYTMGICFVAMSIPKVLANATGTCKEYEPECVGHTQKVLFYTGMALLAVGRAGNAVSEEPFRETQDDKYLPSATKWFRRLGFIIVTVLPIIGTVALQFVTPWSLRFGIPAICTIIATLIFMTGWCGPWKYKKDKRNPDGSPITNVCRVYVAAASKMCISFPLDANMYHRNDDDERFKRTRFLRCLEKAAIIPEGVDPEVNKWRVCSVAEVEEAKILVRMVPMLLTFVICGIVSSSANTYFVQQAVTLNSYVGKLKVPFQILLLIFKLSDFGFCKLACLFLQKETIEGETRQEYKRRAKATNGTYKKVAPTIGIGLGMLFSVLSCIIAAIIEKRRLGVVRSHDLMDDGVVPMSMFWLVFQYILLAGLKSFLMESVSEFYVHQSPESMENYLDHFTGGMLGMGYMFSTVCVHVVGMISEKGGRPSWFQETLDESRLDRYYWFLAGLSSVNLLVFIVVAFFYRYKNLEVQKNVTNDANGGGEAGQGSLELARMP